MDIKDILDLLLQEIEKLKFSSFHLRKIERELQEKMQLARQIRMIIDVHGAGEAVGGADDETLST